MNNTYLMCKWAVPLNIIKTISVFIINFFSINKY